MATRNGTLCQTCGSTTNSLESTDGARSGLRSAVAPNDHKSYTRLRKILGLGNKQAVKEWMDSKAFKPAFQRVYNNWIVVQQDAARQARKFRRCGPDLRAVADDIDDPYAVAEMRYTSLMGVDSLNFDPLHDSATLRGSLLRHLSLLTLQCKLIFMFTLSNSISYKRQPIKKIIHYAINPPSL